MSVQVGDSTTGLRTLVLTALVACALSCGRVQERLPAASGGEDSATIAAREERWLAAFNSTDVDSLVGLYAGDAILMPEGEPIVAGSDAIRAWFEDSFARAVTRQTIHNDEIVVTGDWAYMRGRWTLTTMLRDGGEARRLKGKHLVIWQRQGDGSWKVARDIWNSNGASAAGSAEATGGS